MWLWMCSDRSIGGAWSQYGYGDILAAREGAASLPRLLVAIGIPTYHLPEQLHFRKHETRVTSHGYEHYPGTSRHVVVGKQKALPRWGALLRAESEALS